MATLDTMGVVRDASLDLLLEPVEVGDYVLLHIGFVMSKIDEESARLSLEAYQEIITLMEAEDQELREANA